jgi:hypothetical protein
MVLKGRMKLNEEDKLDTGFRESVSEDFITMK